MKGWLEPFNVESDEYSVTVVSDVQIEEIQADPEGKGDDEDDEVHEFCCSAYKHMGRQCGNVLEVLALFVLLKNFTCIFRKD